MSPAARWGWWLFFVVAGAFAGFVYRLSSDVAVGDLAALFLALALISAAFVRWLDRRSEWKKAEQAERERRQKEAAGERARREQLHEAVAAWVGKVADNATELPGYFPDGIDLDDIRQQVQVVDRPRRDLEAEGVAELPSGPDEMYRTPADWQSSLGEEEVGRRRPWEEVLEEYETLVLLGDPGMGKTWLLRRRAAGSARQLQESLEATEPAETAPDELLAGQPIVLATSIGRVADNLAGNQGSWEAVITAAVHETRLEPRHRERITEWLQERRRVNEQPLVVLLDGLDEYDPDLDAAEELLQSVLGDIVRRDNTRLVVASRIVNYRPPVQPEPPTVQIVPFEADDQVPAFIRAWHQAAKEPAAEASANELLDRIEESSQLYNMAKIPLLLSLLCLAATDPADTKAAGEADPGEAIELGGLPTRRVELYDTVVTTLLARPWTDNPLNPNIDSHAEEITRRRRLLHALAKSMAGDAWQARISREEAMEALREAGSGDATADLRHLGDLLTPAGLAQLEERLWVHRTFHEFLYAEHLANQGPDHAVEVLEPHLWYDPVWHETIVLTGGILDDGVRPLLDAIYGQPNDVFGAMSLLAGEVLAEATDPSDRDTHNTIREIRRLLTSLASVIFDRALAVAGRLGRAALQPYEPLKEALPAHRRVSVAEAAAPYTQAAVVDLIELCAAGARSADNDGWWVLKRAAKVLDRLGESDRAVEVLVDVTVDEGTDATARWWATKALVLLGESGRAVGVLADLLADEDADFLMRYAVVTQLGQLGGPRTVRVLVDLAADEHTEPLLRVRAAEVLDRLGESGRALGVLVDVAVDEGTDAAARWWAASTLAQWGEADRAVGVLADLAVDEEIDMGVRERAAEKLILLGESDRVGEMFADLAVDEETDVGGDWPAAEELMRLGDSDRVVGMFADMAANEDNDVGVRVQAAEVLGQLGQVEPLLVTKELLTAEEITPWIVNAAARTAPALAATYPEIWDVCRQELQPMMAWHNRRLASPDAGST